MESPISPQRSGRSRRLYAILMLGLLLLVTLSTGLWRLLAPNASNVSAAASITGLHVSANHILNNDNQIVRTLGVNRSGTEYECTSDSDSPFDGPNDAASVNAMASWSINAVRVPLNEDCWLGLNGFPAGSFSAAQYQQDIVNYVNLLVSAHIIPIVELHWSAPGKQQATSQQAMPDSDHSPEFWSSVASTFKGNSSVVFDLYNEPHPDSWTCWNKGSSSANASPCGDVDFAVAGMQTLVNTVRGTGATNVIMVGGIAWANDLSGWIQNKPSDPDNNLAASFHLYNFNTCATTSCWNSQVAPVAAQVPLVTGELGEDDCASSFINTAMSWLDQHQAGYLGWAWDTYGCSDFPALITNYNGAPTNFGQGFKAHVIAQVGTSAPAPTPTPTKQPAPPTPTPVPSTPTPTPAPPMATPTPAPPTATPTPAPPKMTPTPTATPVPVTPVPVTPVPQPPKPTPTPPPAPKPPVPNAGKWSFEDGGTDGWQQNGHISTLQNSTKVAKDGKHSLKVVLSTKNANQFATIENSQVKKGPTAGQTVTVYIYVAAGSQAKAALYATGRGFIWNCLAWETPQKLKAGTWNRLTLTLPKSFNGSATHLGIMLSGTHATVYVDAVQW